MANLNVRNLKSSTGTKHLSTDCSSLLVSTSTIGLSNPSPFGGQRNDLIYNIQRPCSHTVLRPWHDDWSATLIGIILFN